jgi:hypothetical protein
MRSLHDVRRAATIRAYLAAIGVACGAALALAHGVPAGAQPRVLVQSSALAGFAHHEAAEVFTDLRVGDALQLSREPDNAFDANAIRVEWHGHTLGYVPRGQNVGLAGAMDRGEPIAARISRLSRHPNPRLRIKFDVYAQ